MFQTKSQEFGHFNVIYISEYTDMEPDMAAAGLFPFSTFNASELQIYVFSSVLAIEFFPLNHRCVVCYYTL